MSRTYLNGFQANSTTFIPTDHAEKRMAQRNLSLDDVLFTMQHGKIFHRAGALIVYLRAKDIPKHNRRNEKIRKLEGTTVILSREEPSILTVYRNRRNGLRKIKRKPKYNCPRPITLEFDTEERFEVGPYK